MSLTGDFAALERFTRQVSELADERFRRRVLEAAKPVLTALVQAEFQLSSGPRGARWKPLKRPRARGRPNKGGPLYDSGELREQASTAFVFGDALVVVVTRAGALVHLYGLRGRVPARPYLPLKTLPPTWRAAFNTAATSVLNEFFA